MHTNLTYIHSRLMVETICWSWKKSARGVKCLCTWSYFPTKCLQRVKSAIDKNSKGPTQGRTQVKGKGGPGPPWAQKFFFLVCKIFQKKSLAPWFLAWAPPWFLVQLPSPQPSLSQPTSKPRSFKEPMTHVN